jgi:anti-sigma factor RsiW
MTPDDATDISDYLLGEVAVKDRIRIERRLRIDPAFRDEVERLIPIRDQLRRLPASEWHAGAEPNICRERHVQERLAVLWRRRPRAFAAAIGGAALVALRAASRARRA